MTNGFKEVIHLIPDSIYIEEFISYILENFPKQKHTFFFFSNENLQYIKKYADKIVIVQERKIKKIMKMYRIFSRKKDCLFIYHGLTWSWLFVPIITRRNNISYWVLWGIEFYMHINFELYDDETKKALNIISRKSYHNTYENKKNHQRIIQVKKIIMDKLWWVLIENIDYVGIDPYQYRLVSKQCNIKRANSTLIYPVRMYNYDFSQKADKKNFKKNKIRILLANSGTPACNHLDNSLIIDK